MLAYDFMIQAFLAGGVVAVLAATVGWFLVLREQSFAGHALSHVGFAGATGALLVGLPPLAGLIGLTVAAGAAMGFLGERLTGRDAAVGLVLALALGLGLLFLTLATGPATQATTLLFGNVFAVTPPLIATLAVAAAVALAALAAIYRPLPFASLQPELAAARGVPLRRLGALFLALVALAVAASAQVVGVLLVFTLLVGPPAANLVASGPAGGIALSAAIALAAAWGGIALAFLTDWPASFWIAALSAAAYGAARLVAAARG